MGVKLKIVGVLVCCLYVPLIGLAGASEEQESILNRITKIEDPELGELIRQAVTNSPEAQRDKAARATLVRRVTEAYLQIKMLDAQIKQTNQQINSPQINEDIKVELTLTRTELETKLTMQLAQLREIMNIVPILEYKHPVGALNTWVVLDVFSHMRDQVYVFKYSKPFYERGYNGWTTSECRPVQLMSPQETIAYIRDLLDSKWYFPLRVDILASQAGRELSEEIKKQIDQMIEEMKLQMMEVEVWLAPEPREDITHVGVVLEQGKAACWGGTAPGLGDWLPSIEWAIREYIKGQWLQRPGFLPLKLRIKFDQESEDLAVEVDQATREAISELAVEGLVELALLRDTFGQRKPVERLNGWLALDVIGDFVYVLKYAKPYHEFERSTTCHPVKVMSQQRAIAYVKDFIESKDQLPLRIDIHRNHTGRKASEELYRNIVQVVKDAQADVETEVYLDGNIRQRNVFWPLALRRRKLYWKDGREFLDVSSHIIHQLTRPQSLPLELYIEFDQVSKDLATKVAQAVQEAAVRSGVEQFVEVVLLERAFGERKPVETLNNWLALDVIDDSVRVFRYSTPYDDLHQRQCEFVNVMSQEKAVAYIADLMMNQGRLPLRIDISRNQAGSKPSEELYKQIEQIVISAQLSAEAEVYLEGVIRPNVYNWEFVLEKGNMYWGDSQVDAEYVLDHFQNVLLKQPKYYNRQQEVQSLPLRLHMVFDSDSKKLATTITEDVREAAKESGVEQFVEIELTESKGF